MARLDPHEGFEILKSRVTGAIESNFPREGSAHTLELEGVQIKDDLDMNDIAAQKRAKLSGTTFGIPVKATMVLKDKGTGKVIEKKTLKVATLPKYTRRHSFIVKGSEYQVDNQWRLKPGIYTRVAQNGELQSRFNFQGKQALDMTFDPKTKVFRMKHGGSKPPLYPILKAVGIDDDTMQAAWGKDILNANKITAKGKALNVDKLAINFAKRLDPRAEIKSFGDASDVINAYMGEAELREDVTKLTLGKAFKKITPDVLTRSSKRLLGVARGEQKPDVRDALMFKDLLSTEDFIAERMGEGTKTIQRRIGNNLDRKDTIREIVGPDVFDRPIREFFSKSSLANTPQQVNPLEMLSGQQRTTITGEGGVKDAHKIMEEAKLVDPSHFGILDALHTPESTKTGVSLHLCTSAVKRGKTVALPLVNVKTGKTELLDPKEINEQIIAMPDEGRWEDGKWKPKGAIVKASVLGNEIREVKSKDVKYVMKNTGQMFSLATNMVPFLNSDSPNRSTMAGRHMEQAIPLKNPEAPLVQSDRGDGRTYDEFVGRYASHEAPVAGKVTKIEPGAIHIKGTDGKSQQIQIYDNYPLNDKKGVFHSTPVVKVGQQVKKGDLISDSNFTKNGVYAPGTNLKVGYSPWKGLNFEDGVVISDTAASKLTSNHLYKKSLSTQEAQAVGLKKFMANKSTALTKDQMGKLGDDGIIKPGLKVTKGDTLVAALSEKAPTTEAQMLKNLHRSLANPYDNRSVTWDQDCEGEVVAVNTRGKDIQVHVRTAEPMQVGDKLSNRHGGKGIVSRILPDHEMPQTEDGGALEVVMNPIGIAGRLNVGQVLETAAGKLAKKTGKTYKIQNFGEVDNRTKVEQDLKRAKISDKETIIDPINNKKVPGVLVGDQYIIKLQHQVDKKMMARSRAGYDRNLIPKGGGAHGAQALGSLGLYAMLSHGAKCLMGGTTLRTKDGGRVEISDVVRNRRKVEVLCADPETKEVDYKPIVAWSVRVAEPEELICISVAASNPSGRKHLYKLKCTDNHTIYTGRGKIQAGDLEEGDWLLTPGVQLHVMQRQMILGSVLGDGYLNKSDTFASSYRVTHGEAQWEYCNWKRMICAGIGATKLSKTSGEGSYSDRPKFRFWTRSVGELSELRQTFYPDGKKIIPQEVLNELNEIGLAFWFMDDGSTDVQTNRPQKYRTVRLATCDFDDKSNDRAQKWFLDRWGLDSKVYKKKGKYPYIHFFNKNAIKFLKIVAPYIHETMRYKLRLDVDHNGFSEEDLERVGSGCSSLLVRAKAGLEKVAVLSIDLYELKYYENYLVYNVEVEDHHNYVADGVLVGNSNIREMQTLKSDKAQADEVWSALQAGEPIPPPQTTFAYKKFESYLKGMGVNVEKDGNSLNLMPLTDKQVLEMSNGELKDAGRAIRGYKIGSQKPGSIEPEKSGLFDPHVTGGLDGLRWSHLSLAEPLPNPVFEKAAKSVAGIRGPQFNRLISGEEGVTESGEIVPKGTKGATYGPQSVGRLLDVVDVEGDLKKAEARLPNLKNQPLNETRKKVKYLRALKKLDMSPRDAYMMQKVPVMPPAMRPLSTTSAGDLQFDDLNQLYKDVALLDQQLREQPSYSPESIKAEPRAELYDRMQALTGMGGSLKDRYKGIANIISGDSPKYGFVQDKLIKRKQDLTMRSTIIPEPSLSLDDIAIPRKAATELYKPFVVREMRMSTGMGPLTAKQMVEGDPDHALVKSSLQRVVEERPLLVKRDPALHKYNIQAFKPKLVEGKAIKIHPLICSGFGADFDGDSIYGKILVELSASLCHKNEDMAHLNRIASGTRCVEIADFPRVEESCKQTSKGIKYLVPKGVKVPAYKDGEIRMMPVTEFSVHPECREYVVRTRAGREVRCSSDHSLAVLDLETLEVVKARPEGSAGFFVPAMRRLTDNGGPTTLRIPPGKQTLRTNEVRDSIPLGWNIGWWFGAFVGDGWVTHVRSRGDRANQVCIAFGKGGEEVAERWTAITQEIAEGSVNRIDNPHEFDGKKCVSSRIQISNSRLGRFVDSLIPCGARNKALPVGFLSYPEDFRWGLFCGLIDTDGSANWSKGKGVKKPQFSLSYTTVSPVLAEEVQLLGMSLGLPSGCTEFSNRDAPAYIITFSTRPVLDALPNIDLVYPKKIAALKRLSEEKISYGRNDIVPLPEDVRLELLQHLRSIGATKKKDKNKPANTQYTVLKRLPFWVTRISVGRLRELIGDREFSDRCQRWWKLAHDDRVSWDVIESAESTGNTVTMYDLTVPDSWTFTTADGLVVWDTMSAYVPMTSEAVDEAHKMLPSRILFNPATANVMYTPTHEAQVGLFMKSEVGKSTRFHFKDQKELQAAVKAGKLEAGDAATVGKNKTTLDRIQMDAALPKKLQGGKLLTDMKYRFTKGEQNQLFNEMARADKNGYAKNIDRMKDMGNLKATHGSFSFGLEDFKVHKNIRDPLLQEAARKTAKLDLDKPKDMERFVEVYEGAMKTMTTKLKAQAKTGKNSLDKLEVSAGIKGKGYVQLTGAPVLFVDAKGDVVPSPVKRSYSEGLSAADYWAAASGGRKGVVQKVQSVSEPGYLTKLMMNSTMDTLVSEKDCGTSKGISLSLDEPDVVGRYTTSSVKAGRTTIPAHTMITPEVVSKMRNSKVSRVLVRSPMRCDHAKGVCASCMGLNESGESHDLGTNVGVLSAQAIGERGTQLAMRAFHEGGLFPGREAQEKSITAGGLDRAMTILHMPKKVKGSAKLSTASGKVGAVKKDPAGGVNITIGDTSHYIPADRNVLTKMKRGATVKKGDPITAGPINPHELLPLTNMNKVQGYLASELHSIYAPEGIRRRNSEVIVRSLSNVTKVESPGDNDDFIVGDFAPTSTVNDWNKKNRKLGKLPMRHSPVLRGVKQIPLDVQTDWLARLNHENLRGTIVEAAQQGWASQLHGDHPIPPLIYGAEFGKGTKKKPWSY